MLFLSFALGDKVRIIKGKKDRAQLRMIRNQHKTMKLKDKVNRELEVKVRERTIELNTKSTLLEEYNLKILQQSTEISQINSILDLDNWKLKNNIKDVLEERLHNKNIDFDQFRKLYPDKLSCFRYLETLKWGTSYSCQQCSNDKSFQGAGKFARRCTKCGYNESITSNTLFKGIKFPIEKAFYIAYVAVAYKKGPTLEQLSTQLELNMNTVWSFKKKAMDSIKLVENSGKKVHVASWEDIIIGKVNKKLLKYSS